MAFITRLFRKRTKAPSETSYVHISRDDGTKYIEPDEYIRLPQVQKQIEQLPNILESRARQ